MKPRVIIIGGRGLQGRHVASLLEEALGGPERIVIAGRRGPVRLDVNDPGTLEMELRAGDVVIDAAAPYRHDPRPLVRICVNAHAHYIDLSQDPYFQAKVKEFVHALGEHPFKSAIMTGCSTVPGMVDALMPLLARPGVRSISQSIMLSMGTRNKLSSAMLYSLLRPLGRRYNGGRWWHETLVRKLGDGRWRRYGGFPAKWPLSQIQLWSGFDRRAYWYLLRLFAVILPLIPDQVLWRLCQVSRPFVSILRLFGTHRSSLRIEIIDEYYKVRAMEVRADQGNLMIPSMPAAWAAKHLLYHHGTDEAKVGMMTLRDVMTAKDIAGELQEHGHVVQVRREEKF